MSAGMNRGEACVLCPYYRAARGKVIECEGGLDAGGTVIHRFRSIGRRERYMEGRCCRDYGDCPVCRGNDAAAGFARPSGGLNDSLPKAKPPHRS